MSPTKHSMVPGVTHPERSANGRASRTRIEPRMHGPFAGRLALERGPQADALRGAHRSFLETNLHARRLHAHRVDLELDFGCGQAFAGLEQILKPPVTLSQFERGRQIQTGYMGRKATRVNTVWATQHHWGKGPTIIADAAAAKLTNMIR